MSVQITVNSDSVSSTINGKGITVPKGTTLYQAAKELGIDIPIFCYHDRMPPFGACRMCLVEVEKMPKLQTACTLEVTEGMVVHTHSEMSLRGREQILELLLINHPLDCPICDRGGECPLQDQTLNHGPGTSRFYEEKRHFKKALSLGPVLMLDRERCITCARCTRFGDVVAGDNALEFIERGYRTEVGTPGGGPVESKFIGNTIQICPVGALTSNVYRFRARPWDNDSADTTCTLCPVGCSMVLDSRNGEIMRTRSRENKDVNDIWLCDKGWFGYEFASHPDRLQYPLVRRGDKLEPATWEEALSLVAKKFVEAVPHGKLAALGGGSLTAEENFLLQKLMRDGAGVNHVDHRLGVPLISLDEEGLAPGMEISIGDCEDLSFAVLCGVNLTEEFPVIWLRLKQAINRGATVIYLGHFVPEIARHLTETILHSPGSGLENLKRHLPLLPSLSQGEKGAIFVGRQYLANPNRKSILSELLKFREGKPNVSINIMDGFENSMGARLAGMHPELGPLGRRIDKPGFNSLQVMEKAADSGWDFLYVAGADAANHFPKKIWRNGRDKLGFLVVQDLFLTKTAMQADVVLPVLSFVEKSGHFINIEARIQKINPGKNIPKEVLSDGEIFTRLAHKLNLPLELDEDFRRMLETPRLVLGHIHTLNDHAPASFKHKLSVSFAQVLFDHGVRMRHNSHLIQLAKEPRARISPIEAAQRNIKHGDTVHIHAKNGKSISVKIKFDKGVAEGTLVLPVGFDEIPVYELEANLINGLEIELWR